jgi:uncharacterized protein (DUF1499 family)
LKTLLITAAVIVAAAVVLLLLLALLSRSGKVPGLVDGKLSPCPSTPNCVCSEYADDARHYIEPLSLSAATGVAHRADVVAAIEEIDGEIQLLDDHYVGATFSSALFGFVDDVEIRIDKGGELIHFRSASRVGYSDGGVNRNRVHRLKSLIESNTAAETPAAGG